MFEHLVVFKFNDKTTLTKQQELVDQLLALQDQIPGIVGLTAGINVTEETDRIQGYTIGLRVTFEDQEALRAYGPHPAHQAFVASLDGWVEDVIVVDYAI
ncbi:MULTISPECIES: Dabb family protein [unclassified Paenibacillus]|uniref:Dabb family protein n=1 Tax=unclassified Paenibacillus TaxID=185978 RepID=UPI000CFDEFE8|nr:MULTISPECIES: Dabb family protein [unclassified Paenibacillus]MBD8836595.1 Dabb family protein [Paenibacillus sp. CFBP 13594]PRA04919.1 stress protein [Paenibacillus sp. MYb63]PRA47736.1 stress protein [Paenibacillus sp. MYb67]QZN74797.1 Dabb family protein [Paenibacillus sp. DR312]